MYESFIIVAEEKSIKNYKFILQKLSITTIGTCLN